jgi:Cdc6-like AAA superfamily ATPase
MKSITLFHTDAPVPLAVYYLGGLLLLWAGYVACLAWQLWRVRQQNTAQLKQELEDATVAAPGQPDQPTATDTLQMGVAPVVVGLLTHPLTNEPYTVALSGDWGSGKSSVMLQIESLLSEAKFPFKGVHINVWHFQQEDQLLAGFLRMILARCNNFRFRSRQIAHNLRSLGLVRTLFRALLLALSVPVLLYVGLALLRGLGDYLGRAEQLNAALEALGRHAPGRWLVALFRPAFYVIGHVGQALPTSDKPADTPWTTLVPKLPVLLALLTLVGSVVGSLRKLPSLVRPLLELIPYQQQYEVAQGEAGFRQRYQQDFRTIIRSAAGETLVIFIDDIDRISGARVLELLETLNFIVTSAQVRSSEGAPGAKLYFILAMNVPEVVRVLGPVLDARGQLDPEAQSRLAASYLAKLVDLTVRIPSLQGRDIGSLFEFKNAPQPTPT